MAAGTALGVVVFLFTAVFGGSLVADPPPARRPSADHPAVSGLVRGRVWRKTGLTVLGLYGAWLFLAATTWRPAASPTSRFSFPPIHCEAVRVARFVAPGQPVEVGTIEDPTPGPNEVVVRVEACGICASDLHFIRGEMHLPVPPPVTMGHEAAGTIAAVGTEVPVWREGDRVALLAGKGCHECDRCALGLFDECRRPLVLGVHYDGAWAEYVKVPWYGLVRAPDGVPFELAAVACDAVATPFAALAERGALQAGERVGLWGIGGLGTHAVQLARLMGASYVAAVDPLPQARARALALGADVALDPAEDVPHRVREGARGLDLALDLVGDAGAIEQALSSLSRGGRVVVVGQSMQTLTAGPIMLVSYLRRSVLGHLGYGKHHLERVLDLIASGRLDLSGSVSGRLPLEAVNEGIERLRTKAATTVRLLLMPQPSG